MNRGLRTNDRAILQVDKFNLGAWRRGRTAACRLCEGARRESSVRTLTEQRQTRSTSCPPPPFHETLRQPKSIPSRALPPIGRTTPRRHFRQICRANRSQSKASVGRFSPAALVLSDSLGIADGPYEGRLIWAGTYCGAGRRGRRADSAGALAAALASMLGVAMAEEARLPGEAFRDCADCTELVIVPNGEPTMGSKDEPSEAPPHGVVIPKAFATGRA